MPSDAFIIGAVVGAVVGGLFGVIVGFLGAVEAQVAIEKKEREGR